MPTALPRLTGSSQAWRLQARRALYLETMILDILANTVKNKGHPSQKRNDKQLPFADDMTLLQGNLEVPSSIKTD